MMSRSRLIWQCRRGTLELDTLLSRYLEQCYQHAASTEQAAFHQLLNLEDQQIYKYLSAQAVPDTPELINLVTTIRTLVSSTDNTNPG